MKFFVLLIIMFELCSFTTGSDNKSYRFNTRQADASQYVIIKFDKAYYWLFKNAKPTTLNVKEVQLTEALLTKAADEYNKRMDKQPYLIKPLSGYKRQFIPVLNSKGEKEVWINCLCGQQGNRWRKEIIIVSDGGNCYFNLKVNLATKTYYHLAVNGYA